MLLECKLSWKFKNNPRLLNFDQKLLKKVLREIYEEQKLANVLICKDERETAMNYDNVAAYQLNKVFEKMKHAREYRIRLYQMEAESAAVESLLAMQ